MIKDLPTPEQIRAKLEEYVIGQEDAKKVISVAVYNHYKRINYASSGTGDVEIKKSNIIMVGPTGSGKTYICTTLARSLGVPIALCDATLLIGANNFGLEIEKMLIKLYHEAKDDIKSAQQGIIFIDEIDKLVTGVNRLKGESVQQALLKVLEGTINNITVDGKVIPFDTNNVLFIAGGAFVALASIIQIRLADTKAGLLTETELVKDALPEDFSKFGLIPEFCGRMPVVVALTALGKEELIQTLMTPKNAIGVQFIKMFALDGIELVYRDDALIRIAEKAIALKTGARGLRTVIEKSMRDIMYQVPSHKNINRITITPEVVDGTGEAVYEYIESKGEIERQPLKVKTPRGRE